MIWRPKLYLSCSFHPHSHSSVSFYEYSWMLPKYRASLEYCKRKKKSPCPGPRVAHNQWKRILLSTISEKYDTALGLEETSGTPLKHGQKLMRQRDQQKEQDWEWIEQELTVKLMASSIIYQLCPALGRLITPLGLFSIICKTVIMILTYQRCQTKKSNKIVKNLLPWLAPAFIHLFSRYLKTPTLCLKLG